MKRVLLLFTMIAAGALMLVPAKPASADNIYGTIRGVVKDQSGAVIPGAQVIARDVSTGITHQFVTGSDGTFEFLNLLAPATYTVQVQKSGFQSYASRGIHLNLNQVFVVNAVMRVGAVTQQITVQANTAQIDTTSMQLGTSLTGKQIVDLPLNGRDWTQLQQLQPGVVASSDRFGTYSTNGSETQQNSYLINGTDSMDIPLNTPGIIPSPDAIAEFHMVTSTINPEFARNSGAILNAVIKNGTNQFHGDGFEFYRDTTLDARNFFQSTVAPFHRNQFGGTIGGPVWKNHTFFFFSYQGNRNLHPQSFALPTVFSADERTGNFSADTGGAFPANNPNTGAPAISPFPMVGINGTTYPAGTPYSTLFPTGVVPTADLNPLAVKLMNQFVPNANAANNQYTFNPSVTALQDQYITRIDQNIGSKDAIWGYWLWERDPRTQTLPFTGATLPGFEEKDLEHFQEYTVDWNHIFSSTTINEARLGYFRFNYDAVVPANPINPTQYGFTGIIPQIPSEASLPVMNITGYFTLGFTTNGPQPRIDQQYNFVDNFSKIAGRHTLKFGFNMDRIQVANPFLPNLGGSFGYSGSGTFSTGFSAADFLLGIPDTYAQGSGVFSNVRAREYYSYAQDQFQFRPNLTFTYGLGWDIETPYVNLADGGKLVNAFRPGQQSTVFPTAPVGLLWPGDKGISNTGGPTTPYTDFAPRAGFAWSPGSSRTWSVRGGFGLYYNRISEEGSLQNIGAPPFALSSGGVADIGGSPYFATPFTGTMPIYDPTTGKLIGETPNQSIPNKFPFTPPAPGSNVNFGIFEPMSLNIFSQHYGVPMSENYNLTIERQVTPSMIFSIGYVGNVAHHLLGAQDLQYAGTAPGVNQGAAALGCSFGNLGFCDPGSFNLVRKYGSAYDPSTFGDFGEQTTNFNSNYNSLQVSVNKSFTHGLQFQASYTWSRYFDYTSNLESSAFNAPGIDPFDWRNMYGPSDNDAPQRFVFNYYYTLPIYHFIHRLRPLTDGWTLTGITTFQSGFPLGLFNSGRPSLSCWAYSYYACPDRPNVTGAPDNIGNPRTYAINGSSNYYFNPAAFSAPGPGAGIGNSSRNPLHGPGLNDFDIALEKDIYITESKYIELRLETFNTFNHTQFTGVGSNSDGGVITDINDPRFGRVVEANDPRILQLGGKIYF